MARYDHVATAKGAEPFAHTRGGLRKVADGDKRTDARNHNDEAAGLRRSLSYGDPSDGVMLLAMQLRLADPLIGLSGVGDLSRAPDPGQAARTCFVACRLARVLDVPDSTVQDVFYTALLQHVGCTGYAHDTAAVFAGRDIEMNAAGARTDFSSPADIFLSVGPAEKRALDLGATKAPAQPAPDRWRVLVDPAGHPFCLGPASSYPS